MASKRDNPVDKYRERAKKVLEPEFNAISQKTAESIVSPMPALLLGPGIGKLAAGATMASGAVGNVVAGRRYKKAEDSITADLPKIDAAKAKNASKRRK